MPKGIYKRKPISDKTRKKMSESKKKEWSLGLRISGMTGKKHSKETKLKIGLANSIALKGRKLSDTCKEKLSYYKGDKSPSWRGDDVGYGGLHKWVYKNLGKAKYCEICGLRKIPSGKTKYSKKRIRFFQWANISHKYKRNLTDWKQMCIRCHRKYDIKYNHQNSAEFLIKK